MVGVQGIFWDVTERKLAEQELEQKNRLLEESVASEREALEQLKKTQSHLVQTEKLAGLGQMVAGVAHEINNPLAFVINNVAVLQRDLRRRHGTARDVPRGGRGASRSTAPS